ncbi:sensor histidine kinase [Niastella populi]|uniref:histidine kinase n=1 Tax=Niastella populi TaxID=550983 RepID=A0A1V9G1U9_9BACT|nr:ATP-binding protein [Niastella populi]OQP64619.1 hypothetical protein A4R26_16365 [Niastella populi]
MHVTDQIDILIVEDNPADVFVLKKMLNASALLYLEHAKTHIEVRDEMIAKSLAVITLAVEEIRKLSRQLIVSDVMDIGLKKAIREMIANIQLVKKIDISLSMENFPEKKLDENIKIAVYRIIQEQLTNILKHAAASSVLLLLHKEGKLVTLESTDNGIGFDPTQHRKGVGITNITSRASLFDGEVTIDSAPGKGCKLKVTLQTKN